MKADWVISTNQARCRDCYRCVRTCRQKAVRIENGQAQVVPERCIACGDCVTACPQHAKVVRDDTDLVRQALADGRTVVASVAPSAPAFFDMTSLDQMERALQSLGFAAASETAYGAQIVGQAHKDWVRDHPESWPVITSSCPVIVNLLERYYPDLLPHLAPIASPMIVHGRTLRERYGPDAFVVFVGPCFAKKQEIRRDAVSGIVDAALTFDELSNWLQETNLDFPTADAEPQPAVRSDARAFAVEGGLVGTAEMDTDFLASTVVTTSGLEACEDVLEAIRRSDLKAEIVELMACEGGCINGPSMESAGSTYLARQRVLEFASRQQPQPMPDRQQWPDISQSYSDQHIDEPTFTKEQITEVLRKVDKYTVDDELNCGACGYPTCREKAIATLKGMAETTMCIPYMRRRAEGLRQVVMDVTPNAILIVDTRLYLQDMSPSAEEMLGCQLSQVQGHPLQEVLPVIDGFSQVRNSRQPVLIETVALRPNLTVEQIIVPVEGQSLLVGILRDITETQAQQAEIERLRDETLVRTQAVVEKQMRVAQEIAQLLGETTAETKMMLTRLASVLQEEQQ